MTDAWQKFLRATASIGDMMLYKGAPGVAGRVLCNCNAKPSLNLRSLLQSDQSLVDTGLSRDLTCMVGVFPIHTDLNEK